VLEELQCCSKEHGASDCFGATDLFHESARSQRCERPLGIDAADQFDRRTGYWLTVGHYRQGLESGAGQRLLRDDTEKSLNMTRAFGCGDELHAIVRSLQPQTPAAQALGKL
jgi:hypothetical protein